jgi:two-component system invasion response regulator UvrY
MIHILIIDDQELVRTGLRHTLARSKEISKISEASSGELALSRGNKLQPDVILLSVNLPGLTGFEMTRKLTHTYRHARIIILAVHAKPPYPTRLMDAGSRGYLTRDCDEAELMLAIRTVARGQRYIGSEAAKQLALSMLPGSGTSPFEDLSAREMEVMLKLTDGRRIPDIASLMCLSPKTVSTYKYRILGKLGANSEVEMMRMAMRYGLVEGA